MDRAEKIRRVEQHFRAFWQGDLDDLDQQLAPDFVDDEDPGAPPGPAHVKEMATMARTAFPDMVVTVDDAVVEGPAVAVVASWHGTHLGPFLGQPPTGRTVDFKGIMIWRFDEQGRIVRRTAYVDRSAVTAVLAGPDGGQS